MTTLFQLHANINTLKSVVRDMAVHWQADDAILLLGETAAYSDWLMVYIEDLNNDEDSSNIISHIGALYVLKEDIEGLNDIAKGYMSPNHQAKTNAPKISVLSDDEWVDITQSMDRVVTLNSAV